VENTASQRTNGLRNSFLQGTLSRIPAVRCAWLCIDPDVEERTGL